MLTETMMQVKQDLKKMENYVKDSCKSPLASRALLKIIANERLEVNEIDTHIVQGEYLSAFSKIAAHVSPRKQDFYIRRNYDYGEFWPAALDAFRDGKIKNVVEMARKLRRWPEGEEQNVSNDNEEHIDTKVDNPDKDKKKKLNRATLEALAEETLFHLDSYCGTKENKEYWSKMEGEEEFSQAVKDFLKYIEEIKC